MFDRELENKKIVSFEILKEDLKKALADFSDCGSVSSGPISWMSNPIQVLPGMSDRSLIVVVEIRGYYPYCECCLMEKGEDYEQKLKEESEG